MKTENKNIGGVYNSNSVGTITWTTGKRSDIIASEINTGGNGSNIENELLKSNTDTLEVEKTGLIVKVCRDGSPIPFSNSKMDYYAGAIIEYINTFGSCPQIGLRINFEDFDVIYIKKISFNHTAITFYLHSEL